MKKKNIVLIVIVVITAMISMSLTASAVSNNDIASTAIGYEGQTIHGCECKCFAQRAVNEAAGSYVLGTGYADCYSIGTEIEESQAMWGDIIQISNNTDPECDLLPGDDIYPGMHTAIVLENNEDNEFKVIDSNYLAAYFIGTHNWNPSSWAAQHNIDAHFYRLGTTDTWDFEIPTYTQGWKHHNTEGDHYSVQDGKYFIDPVGSDPYIQLDGLILDASKYNAFRINASNNCKDSEAAMYFTTTTSPEYGEDKKIPFWIINGGTWNSYFIFIEDEPLWKDIITGIRIYPANEGISGDNSDTVGFELIDLIYVEPPPVQTIYVPDDYPTIQEAVDSAEQGDAIIVRDGTYVENININTDHLTIKSENGADSTIVEAEDTSDHVFEINADYVNISGLTATGATGYHKAGFYLYYGDCCNISDNAVLNNDRGIYLYYSNNNKIKGSVIDDNVYGIYVSAYSDNNIVSENIVNDSMEGISLRGSSSNTVDSNIINSNGYGIRLDYSYENTISNNIANGDYILLYNSDSNNISCNTIENNEYGIKLYVSNNNIIYLNDFIDNTNNAYSYGSTNLYNSPNQITYTHLGNTHTNYLGNYYSDYTDIDSNNDGIWDNPYSIDSDADNYPLTQPSENYLPQEPSVLEITVFCPVNLLVTDPDGLTINIETNEIPEATYTETDINGDGDPDDIITIPNRKTGNYEIQVIPEPNANPSDTFTLKVSTDETSIILAENVSISDIPNIPYTIESNETGITDKTLINPQGGIGIAVLPRINHITSGETVDFTIKIVNNENFDDVFHVYINNEDLPASWRADTEWFNWTTTNISIPSKGEATIQLKADIPINASGNKAFRAIAESTRWTPVAYDTGILYIS